MKGNHQRLQLLALCALLMACGGDDPLQQAGKNDSKVPAAPEDIAKVQDSKAPDVNTVPKRKPDTNTSTPDTATRSKDTGATSPDIQAANDAGPPDTGPPEEPEVKIVAFGDAGKGNDGQVQVAQAIKEKCEKDGCDFILLLGDNIYNSGVDSVQDPQWQEKFEAPYADLDVVFRPSMGNHDNGGLTMGVGGAPLNLDFGGGTGMEFWKGDIQVDYSAHSEKWDMPARYYDWTGASAHFFALDTNSMMFDQHADQAADMVNRINQSEATWKIAYGHHPYISNGRHGNAGSYELPDWLDDLGAFVGAVLGDLGDMILGTGVKAGLDTIVCSTDIDLYLSGHDHNRQWLPAPESCPGVEFVVSGAGASTTDFEDDQTSFYQDDTMMGFVWIRIKGKTLHAEFIDTTGTINFVHDLQK